MRYNDLIREVTQLLTEKEVSCTDMVSYIISLPPERIGEHYNVVMRQTADSSAHQHIYQFMTKLTAYMQFMDYRLLKEIVFHFAQGFRPGLLAKMDSYEVDIEEFCQNTTIASFICNWREVVEVPEYFTTLQVKYNLDPNRCTLKDLKELQATLGQKLGLYQRPQQFECAMILSKVVNELVSSVSITWLIPTEVEPDLMAAMSNADVRKFFDLTGIRTVLIEGKLCYSENRTSSQESDSTSEDKEPEEDVTPTPTPIPTKKYSSKSEGEEPESKCCTIQSNMSIEYLLSLGILMAAIL